MRSGRKQRNRMFAFSGRLLAVFLAVAMMIGLLPIPGAVMEVKADGPDGIWSDYAASSFAGGSGTSADPYLIETAGQLVYMAQQTSTSKYYKLMADIDLAAHEWVTYSWHRTNTLDGNDHTISNMTQKSINVFYKETKHNNSVF